MTIEEEFSFLIQRVNEEISPRLNEELTIAVALSRADKLVGFVENNKVALLASEDKDIRTVVSRYLKAKESK